MNLIPFSKKYLQLHEALPFGVRDARGQLLLAAGQRLDSRQRLAELMAKPLFADESESSDWRRRLSATIDGMIRRNESLKAIAAARPDDEDESPGVLERPMTDTAAGWVQALDAALRDPRADGPWLARVQSVQRTIESALPRGFDAALYALIYAAAQTTAQYSGHHAVLCAVIAARAAGVLGGSDDDASVIGRAALTMNVSMRRLQDQLAAQDVPLTDGMRAEIREHPRRSAEMLVAAGVADDLWLGIVRHHHDDGPLDASSDAMHQAARLLRRVDVFAAKLSRRAGRAPMSPVRAAREACIGADGRPDALGAALLKTVGLYPPGSFVELASGEKGIVVSRGLHATQPLVAALVGASGAPLGEPALRDTADRRHAVRGALLADAVRVIPAHDRVLALR